MTNRVLFLNFIVLFSFLPFVATAENMSQSNFYIGGSGAFSHYPSYKPIPEHGTMKPIGIDVIKNGYAFSILAGYRVNENFRVEAEVAYRKHVFDKFVLIRDFPSRNFVKGQVKPLGKAFGYVQSFSYIANVYYDYVNNSNFTPFIGVGAGLVRYEERNKCGDYVRYSPAIQVMSGVSYSVTEKLNLDLGYRYYHMKDVAIKNNCLSPKIKYRTHEGVIGIRVSI
ncbi:MAG: outer membrane beta-barrel protein [Rickettsiaceae bacterium]|nr:outer membrane beta-barrel protein [Rickettsiaceae bacterium]